MLELLIKKWRPLKENGCRSYPVYYRPSELVLGRQLIKHNYLWYIKLKMVVPIEVRVPRMRSNLIEDQHSLEKKCST